MRFGFLLLSLHLCAITGLLHAQRAPAVRVGVDLPTITVGDRATLTVTVQHDTATRVEWPEDVESLGPFEVLELRVAEPIRVAGTLESRAELVLTAFELGELEVPTLDLTVASDTGERSTVQTEPVAISVVSVGQDEGGDIRDIKPPLAIARSWWLVAVWGLAAIVLVTLAWWLYRRFARRRIATEPAAPLTPERPPHEIAYEALERLANSDLLERGEVKRYHVEISEIIRTYLEGRYGIPAMEMTSRDILWELNVEHLTHAVHDQLEEFFVRCDLVKFAKSRPQPAMSRNLIPIARGLVDQTKQVWEEAGVA